MKKFKLVSMLMSVAVIVALIFVSACTKEGPAGKDGVDGKDGEPGINGQDGTATCAVCHDPHSHANKAQLRNRTFSTNYYTLFTGYVSSNIVVTNAGGPGILAADACEKTSLSRASRSGSGSPARLRPPSRPRVRRRP